MNRTVVISIFLLLALFAAACSEDGEGPTSIPGDGSITAPTTPDTTQPPEAQPPDTTQAPEAQPPDTTQPPNTTEAPVDESDGIPTEVWIILGLLLAVAILVGVLIGRGRSASGNGGADDGEPDSSGSADDGEPDSGGSAT